MITKDKKFINAVQEFYRDQHRCYVRSDGNVALTACYEVYVAYNKKYYHLQGMFRGVLWGIVTPFEGVYLVESPVIFNIFRDNYKETHEFEQNALNENSITMNLFYTGRITLEHAIYASNRENLKTLYLLNSLGALTLTNKYPHVYAFSQFRYIVQYNEESGTVKDIKKAKKRK